MKRGEAGQALVETVLALPLLAALLWGSTLLARVFQARLALLDLTREFAVFIARNEAPTFQAQALRRLTLRTLAARLGMQHENVDFSLETLVVPGAARGFPAEAAAGLRLKVSYRFRLPRGVFFLGRELLLSESLALKTDPWRHPAQHLMERLWTR